jgi:hypothetical protein
VTTKFLWLDNDQLSDLAYLASFFGAFLVLIIVKTRYQVRKSRVFVEKYLEYLAVDYRGDEFRKKLKILRQREPQGSAFYTSEFVTNVQAVSSYNSSASRLWESLKAEIASNRFLVREHILELMYKELSSRIVNKFTNEMYESWPSQYSNRDPLRRDLELLVIYGDDAFYEPKIFAD